MTIPSLVLGLVVAVLVGSLFHLFLGGGLGRFFLYIFLSVIGFALGQWLGDVKHWVLFPIGTLDLGMGMIGSLVFLVVGFWFSLVGVHPADGNNAV